ncbi:sigma-70 family RNA polymerase sigma factor [Conexibacter sp. CPCC 206217]|uniref:sigma-70 family RNA polymerase sigma factor n=1 Tax=Conexibacter sp. CPCC 206217 TaxID=3064574 RepID=UPI0027292941|nr:sigma-70 family RNA polymerase sigma factor [Conexibacter sp. CPCC 206217]MDO8209501.1 sigma-70 family RNA polymerase sigma factor [Conexibacter sp. CPCC 206217]
MKRQSVERLADEELMTLVQDGEARALEVLYDRHGGAAYSLAFRIMGDRQTAEDVTQEAFVSIWRAGGRYDPTRGSVRSWVLAILRNRAIDALRRTASRAPRLDYDDDAALESQESPERTDGEALRRERARVVRGALQELPQDQSQVLGLAYFGGFTHREIADLLEVPLGTIKGRMRLGLEKMRTSMDEAI